MQAAHPYLCTTSVKNVVIKRYPGEIVPRLLYLGDWDNALDTERLVELNVRTVVTIHNEPSNMKLPPRFKHVRFSLADVSTEDISQYFAPTYDIIDAARAKRHGTDCCFVVLLLLLLLWYPCPAAFIFVPLRQKYLFVCMICFPHTH